MKTTTKPLGFSATVRRFLAHLLTPATLTREEAETIARGYSVADLR